MQNQRITPRKPQQRNYRGSQARIRARKRKRLKIILAFVVLLLLIIILVGSCGNSEDNVDSFSAEFINAAYQETEFEQTMRTYTTQPTQAPISEVVLATQTPTEKPSLFPQTIFNKNGVIISVTGFDRFGVLGPEIKIAIENSSGMDLIINTGSIHCNGWQVSEFTSYVEVANGAKAGETIYIYKSELEDCGMSSGELVNVQFKGASLVSLDYMNKFEFEMSATLQ